jgi:hypothetical protein
MHKAKTAKGTIHLVARMPVFSGDWIPVLCGRTLSGSSQTGPDIDRLPCTCIRCAKLEAEAKAYEESNTTCG